MRLTACNVEARGNGGGLELQVGYELPASVGCPADRTTSFCSRTASIANKQTNKLRVMNRARRICVIPVICVYSRCIFPTHDKQRPKWG